MGPDLSIDSPAQDTPSVMLLGMGANVGDRAANLREGLMRLSGDGAIRVEAVSGLWASEPVGAAGGEFFNAAVRVRTSLDPSTVLGRIKAIEYAMGRTGSRGDARPLDVDILYCGPLVRNDDGLSIPHPRCLERAFVLAPLAEVCGDARDPVAMRPVADLVADRLRTLGPSARRVAGTDWFEAPAPGTLDTPAPDERGPQGAMR